MANWHDAQVAALIDIGVNPLDAQTIISRVQATMPDGADLATWLPLADQMPMQLDKAALHDARVSWYVDKPAKWKRLLDARRTD